MMTLQYKDLKDMYKDTQTGNLQREILCYLQSSENLFEKVIDPKHLYEHFDAQFDDFDLNEDEIKDPKSIINTLIFKEQAMKHEAANHLHEVIALMYEQYKGLLPRDKESLIIETIYQSDYREPALKDIYNYCSKELDNLKD